MGAGEEGAWYMWEEYGGHGEVVASWRRGGGTTVEAIVEEAGSVPRTGRDLVGRSGSRSSQP